METCQVLFFIIACMDMGFGMYDIPGDLSGYIIFHLKFLQQIGLPLAVIFDYKPYIKVWGFGH